MKLEKSEKVLLAAGLFMCAIIVGYNAFFVPEAGVSTVVQTIETELDDNNELNNSDSNESAGAGNKTDDNKITDNANKTESSNKSVSSNNSDKSGYVNTKVNINTATETELSDNLKGVGSVVAKRIVDYREKNGGFSSIDEIKNVKGIGEKLFARIKDNITVK